jgi:hypothetical protein
MSARNERNRCDDRRAERCERQRVGEVTMIFDREQRIRFAANEYIRIRNECRETAHPCCGASQFLLERCVTQTCAEENVSEWIHA